MKTLTLRKALASGRLKDFVAQQEAAGIGPVEREELDRLLLRTIKAPRSKGQTSRSPSLGGSSGRRTH